MVRGVDLRGRGGDCWFVRTEWGGKATSLAATGVGSPTGGRSFLKDTLRAC